MAIKDVTCGENVDSQATRFFEDTVKELHKAEYKHPEWPSDVVYGCSILNEEAGKLTRACNDYAFGQKTSVKEEEVKVRMYAARVVAMALRLTKGLEGSGPVDTDEEE